MWYFKIYCLLTSYRYCQPCKQEPKGMFSEHEDKKIKLCSCCESRGNRFLLHIQMSVVQHFRALRYESMNSSLTKKPDVLAENGHEDSEKWYHIYQRSAHTEIILRLSAQCTHRNDIAFISPVRTQKWYYVYQPSAHTETISRLSAQKPQT
jgi:hypothetical protein